jgi:hypothetical protein
MTTRRALLSLILAVTSTPAMAGDRFATLNEHARRLDSLGSFLERYVGSCPSDSTRQDCEQNVRATRRGLDGRSYAASVAERTVDIVKTERTRTGYRFVVTPFIDGGGLALTHGEPRRQDSVGRPLIGLLVMEGTLPEGMDELAMESALRTGRVELEVVFRPQGTWRLKRKGEPGFYEGVRAKFLAMRLVESRSGAEIASKVLAE